MSQFSTFYQLLATLEGQLFRDGCLDVTVLQTLLPFFSKETRKNVVDQLVSELCSTTPRPVQHTLWLLGALSKVGAPQTLLDDAGRRVLYAARGNMRNHVAGTLLALSILVDEAYAITVELNSSSGTHLPAHQGLIQKDDILKICRIPFEQRHLDPVAAAARWSEWCVDSPELDSPPEPFTFDELLTVLESGESPASPDLIAWSALCPAFSGEEILELFFFAAEMNVPPLRPELDICHRFLDTFGRIVPLPHVTELVFALVAGHGTGVPARDRLLLQSLPYWAWNPIFGGRVLDAFRDSGTAAEIEWAESVSDAVAKCGARVLGALVAYLQDVNRPGRAQALQTLQKIHPATLSASERDPGRTVAGCNAIATERPDDVL